MRIFPFIELKLSADGLKRAAQLWAKVEGFDSHTRVQLLEFSQIAIGTRDRLFSDAVDVIAEKSAGTKERSHGIDLGLEAAQTDLRHVLGKAMQAQQFRGFQINGHG